MIAWDDYAGLIKEVGGKLGMSNKEIESTEMILLALSMQNVPPVWGYAGMLSDLVASGVIADKLQLMDQIIKWQKKPDVAAAEFMKWNEERLAAK